MKQGKPPLRRVGRLRRGRLNPRSAKRLASLPERMRVVDAAWERDRGRCRALEVLDHECGGPLDPHEIIPRSAWPGGELVLDNVILVCRKAHDWIDTHPTDAHAIGLHGFSWERMRAL